MHFYGMREAPAIPLRDRGLSGCGRLTGREQLGKVAGQLAQAEFDHEDLAALVSRPHTHMPTCESAGLAISMSGCSAERLEPGHLVLAGRRHDVHSGPVSCHCRDRGQGDQRHFLTGVQQGPRLPASEHAPGGLACRFPGARRYRAWKALSRGHRRGRPLAWDGCAGHCRPCAAGGSAPGPAGPADPAGALAAVIAERQQHTSIPGPGGARRSSGLACRSPRSGRRANMPGTDSRRAPPIGDGA